VGETSARGQRPRHPGNSSGRRGGRGDRRRFVLRGFRWAARSKQPALARDVRARSAELQTMVGRTFTLGDAPLLAGDPSLLVPPGLFRRREAIRCLKRKLARTVYTTLKSESALT
jgi:hypothetical protein